MLLTYEYNGQAHQIFVHWTAETGSSTVFQEIIQRVSDKHQLDLSDYFELAKHLDGLVDKLYEQIYIFTDEHYGVPYNPRFRQTIIRGLDEISSKVVECQNLDCSETRSPLAGLFTSVVNKLREVVDVYLSDSAYQCKYRERLRNKEQYIETTAGGLLSYEIEDVLLQMIDLSLTMDCLTALQRKRLVKHIFFKYTLQEIADQEGVTKQSVQESIVAALKTIRQQLP